MRGGRGRDTRYLADKQRPRHCAPRRGVQYGTGQPSCPGQHGGQTWLGARSGSQRLVTSRAGVIPSPPADTPRGCLATRLWATHYGMHPHDQPSHPPHTHATYGTYPQAPPPKIQPPPARKNSSSTAWLYWLATASIKRAKSTCAASSAQSLMVRIAANGNP